MSKNIYLLSAKSGYATGYDVYSDHVIIAPDERTARCFPQVERVIGDEGNIWEDKEKSDCIRIGTASPSKTRVVLSSFHAG